MAAPSAKSCWSLKPAIQRAPSGASPLFFSSPSSSSRQSRRSPATITLRNFSQSPNPSPSPPPQPTASAACKKPRRALSSIVASADGPDFSPHLDQTPSPRPVSRPPPSLPRWRRILASKKLRSIVLLNVITVIFASNIAIVKEAEVAMDPAIFTVVRFGVSAIPFIPFILEAWEDHQTRADGVELGFWVSLGYITQALGLLTSDAGRASFISAFTVIVVPLIDGVFGAVVPISTWFGALASLVGVGMLECSGSPPCVGDILNLSSAIFFGVHVWRTEHITRSTKKEKYLALLGYEVCVAALLSTVWIFCRVVFRGVNHFSFKSLSWTLLRDWMFLFPWLPALYTGIFSTGLCLWAELVAMCHISASETAIIYGLEPVWGAAFAWILLGERWGTTGWIGSAFVLCGSLTVQILGSFARKNDTKKFLIT